MTKPLADRRQVLGVLAGASVLPWIPIAGCDSNPGPSNDDAPSGGSPHSGGNAGAPASGGLSSGGATSGGGSGDGGDSSGGDNQGGEAGQGGDGGDPVEGWASGGTQSMTDKSSYPNPFDGTFDSCVLLAAATEGPCTTEGDLPRQDISEGWSGLPMRLALRIVDAACDPVVGVVVKIWHTNLEGSYSGQTPDDSCLTEDSYAAENFFRGTQTTNAAGEVYFDTCFPGWYVGRAVHVHFEVRDETTLRLVSQLFFAEEIVNDIFTNHEEYVPYGQPDSITSTDDIMISIPEENRNDHILSVAHMTDGAMLASAVVTIS